MSESNGNLKRRTFCGVTMGGILPAMGLVGQSSLAGDDRPGRGKKRPKQFEFYKLLQTEFPEPTWGGPEPFVRNNKAYWYGRGRFRGSRKTYNLQVTLPFDRKFPGYGLNKGEHESFQGMGVITPTQMTYRITRRGERPIVIVFKGGANLMTGAFFLHNGRVTPEEGWPGAYDCPVGPVDFVLPNPPTNPVVFRHMYNLQRNIWMEGTILPVPAGFPNAGLKPWNGSVVNPCFDPNEKSHGPETIPSAGPRYIEGVITFPVRGRNDDDHDDDDDDRR